MENDNKGKSSCVLAANNVIVNIPNIKKIYFKYFFNKFSFFKGEI